jgi:hypothetical protein
VSFAHALHDHGCQAFLNYPGDIRVLAANLA